jgi:predicted negative regulator of RcsB-dependent stress response
MIWIAVAFLLVAVLGPLGFAAVRAWRLWRTFRAVERRASKAIGRVTDTAEEAERHAVALTGNAERLATATARLQGSLAQLAVLRTAFAEGRAAFSSVRGTVPRK